MSLSVPTLPTISTENPQLNATMPDSTRDPELIIPTSKGVERIKPVSEQTLWDKLARYGKRAGRTACEKALCLWYTATAESTPAWARRTAYGALAYFILPLDAIPDIIPGVGFTDDLTALTAALGAIAMHITPEIKDRASEKLKTWFG